jgi:hypothetical protein
MVNRLQPPERTAVAAGAGHHLDGTEAGVATAGQSAFGETRRPQAGVALALLFDV